MFDPIHRAGSAVAFDGRKWCVALAEAIRFFSRLPVPRLPFEATEGHQTPGFSTWVRIVPLAGAVIGLPAALVLASALTLGLDPFMAAALAIAALTLSTGFLHEDGLADTADSTGGKDREQRLAIMRDSRIGSYGASALILAFLLRVGALASIASQIPAAGAALSIIAAAALSRTAALAPMAYLSPARKDGLAHAVGRPERGAFRVAVALAAGLTLAAGAFPGVPFAGAVLMIVSTAFAAFVMTRFSSRHLGGQTGDIAGATQQVAEIAAMIGLLIALGQ